LRCALRFLLEPTHQSDGSIAVHAICPGKPLDRKMIASMRKIWIGLERQPVSANETLKDKPPAGFRRSPGLCSEPPAIRDKDRKTGRAYDKYKTLQKLGATTRPARGRSAEPPQMEEIGAREIHLKPVRQTCRSLSSMSKRCLTAKAGEEVKGRKTDRRCKKNCRH
jgi:hypothetical protein